MSGLQYLDLVDDYDLIPDQPDLAVDLVGWPWYGTVDDDDTPPDEREQPPATEGTKPGRNYSYAFQFATISLVNCQLPMTFAARSISRRKRKSYHLRLLLEYAEAKFDVGRVCLDNGFYREYVKIC